METTISTDNQDELFVVVDQEDKLIGYHTRFECHHNKQLIHRAIGVVIFNDKDQILLQKRSKNKDLNPGLYTISTSGHVDKGETYRQTAKRELSEELGIQIPIIQKKRFLAELGYETEMHCLFTARSNGPFYPDKNEVDKVKFVSKNELKKIKSKLTPSAKLSLKQLSLL